MISRSLRQDGMKDFSIVPIVDSDRVTVDAAIGPTLTFDFDTATADTETAVFGRPRRESATGHIILDPKRCGAPPAGARCSRRRRSACSPSRPCSSPTSRR